MSQSIINDEIDFIELTETLWAGKWLIIFSSIFFLLVGLLYGHFATKIYQLEVRLETPACNTSGAGYVDWNCEEAVFFAVQARLLDLWNQEFSGPILALPNSTQRFSLEVASPFKLQTSDPLPLNVYQEALDQLILDVSVDLLKEAERMNIVLARPELADVSHTDVVSRALLKSQIVANLVRETSGSVGSLVILPSSFSAPVSPKTNPIMALCLVLGVFVGAAGVLLRKVICDRVSLAGSH